ncbi:MAG: FtsQ-type POTRA domain-containing protein [Victivallales bacterium]|nr:FtsQ-type POTRA domain-containing protein [Victivallales bacterium]
MKKHEDHSIEALGDQSRKNSRLMPIVAVIIILALLSVLGLLCRYGIRQLYRENPAFRITTIDIATPCEQLRPAVEECLQRNQIQEGLTTLTSIDIRNLREELIQDPRVLTVEVRRVFPGTLRIAIKPRVPVAELILPPQSLRIDQEGYVLPGNLPGNTDRLPCITNLRNPEHYVIGKHTEDPFVLAFLSLLRECALRTDGATYEISSVQMEPEKEKMILFLKGNDIFEENAAVFMLVSNVPAHLDRLQYIVEHRRKLNKKISFVDLTVNNIPVRPE